MIPASDTLCCKDCTTYGIKEPKTVSGKRVKCIAESLFET